MKGSFTILGCGSSLGSPWINNYWGKSDKKKIKNHRTRCCAHIEYGDLSVLIDTSPDIKNQLLNNKIKNVDAIMYTHEHTDQTSGIFELRPFFWKRKKKIEVYAQKRIINEIISKYTFCFFKRHGYQPIMKAKSINNNFLIKKNKSVLNVNAFQVKHGLINATGFLFNNIAYISDCNKISLNTLNKMKNKLEYLIIDCLRMKKHPSHFNFDEAMKVSNYLNPNKTILTNLHVDLDYYKLQAKLPKKVLAAYDGLKFNF